VIRAVDENKDGKFSDDELASAQKKPAVIKQLSQLVCLHPSEWQVDSDFKKWESFKAAPNFAEAKKQISALVWWDAVKSKLSGFPGPSVYHIHPLAFVDQMSKYVAATRLGDNDKHRIVNAIAMLESGGRPYSAANLDYEFQGYFDKPDHWNADKSKAKPDSLNPAVPYSKYSDHPRHVGLSFGLIQFTQEGPLGRLVRTMQAADSARFAAIFGAHAQDLINGLSATGTPSLVEEEVFDNTGASMGKKKVLRQPSVQPVAGHEVWEPFWVEKFVASAKEGIFQTCQRSLAVSDYLDAFLPELEGQQLSEKTITLLYDRSVNQGAAFAKGLAQIVKAANFQSVAEEQSFWAKYIVGRTDLIKNRMNHLSESATISWEHRYDL
jgi:hypothetical protein